MDPGPSTRGDVCPYCEGSHTGPCYFGTPEKAKKPEHKCETPKKQKNFICDICLKDFSTRGKLSQHRSIHTGEKRYSCEHCSKGFNSKFKLVRHLVVHSRTRGWTCDACGTGFRRKDHLETHLRQHCGDRVVHPCPKCTKTYSCKGSLRKHTALHAAQEGELDCKLCSFLATTQAEILAHLRIHSGSRLAKSPSDKKYRCTDCERTFFTRKDARRHSVVHTKKRDFLCQYCPRAFGRRDHLSRHIGKRHMKEEGGGGSESEPAPPKPSSPTPTTSGVLPGFSQAFKGE